MKLTLEIHGEPRPKQRARAGVNKATGKLMMYQQKDVHDYANQASPQARRQLPSNYSMPAKDVPIGVAIDIYWPMPASWSAKKKLAMEGQFKTSKPDADNLCKAILDPLSGIVWVDDCQVQLRRVFRMWTNHHPQVVVWLEVATIDPPAE